MSARVYLDWNATTPPHPTVLDAMRAAHEAAWGNPASIHAAGRAARAVVEDARAAVAALTGTDARDVVFTSGGTEANNLALRSLVTGAGATGAGVTVVTSRIEHPSITRVAEALEREGKARVRWLRVEASGVIDRDDLGAALREPEAKGRGSASVVAVMAVNHETGAVQPLEDVFALARASGARVHVDAVQAWGKIAVPPGADSMSVGAHKFRGPKGIGALVTKPGVKISPVVLGGSQERGVRPGTVDAALAAGLGAAAARAEESRVHLARIAALRDRLEEALVALGGVRTTEAPRAPHVSLLRWPGWVGAELVAALDLEGVCVSSGAACSAGTVEPSPVLLAMLGEREPATTGVRASLGEDTTDDDVARAIDAYRRVLGRARG
jgi:cysteine desulfurase